MIRNTVLGLGLAGLVSCRSSCAPDFNYPPKNEQLHLCGRLTKEPVNVNTFLNGWTPMYIMDLKVKLSCGADDTYKLDPKEYGKDTIIKLKLKGMGTVPNLRDVTELYFTVKSGVIKVGQWSDDAGDYKIRNIGPAEGTLDSFNLRTQ